jgi:hypothetical protein
MTFIAFMAFVEDAVMIGAARPMPKRGSAVLGCASSANGSAEPEAVALGADELGCASSANGSAEPEAAALGPDELEAVLEAFETLFIFSFRTTLRAQSLKLLFTDGPIFDRPSIRKMLLKNGCGLLSPTKH